MSHNQDGNHRSTNRFQLNDAYWCTEHWKWRKKCLDGEDLRGQWKATNTVELVFILSNNKLGMGQDGAHMGLNAF